MNIIMRYACKVRCKHVFDLHPIFSGVDLLAQFLFRCSCLVSECALVLCDLVPQFQSGTSPADKGL